LQPLHDVAAVDLPLIANAAAIMKSVRSVIQWLRFPLDIMLLCVRWYVTYPLSLRNLEEMMQERGIFVDHSTIHAGSSSWFRCWRKPFVNGSANEASVRSARVGAWTKPISRSAGKDRYWYRAVDKQGYTVDFLLTAKRDGRAARRFFTRAVKNCRLPKIVNIDKSGANKAGIGDYNAQHGTNVVIRQCKYLNNIVVQDHRAVKRITRPVQGFKDFRCARIILSGVELMHMIRKGQMRDDGRGLSAAQHFYLLAE
jgi:transposase-like protein